MSRLNSWRNFAFAVVVFTVASVLSVPAGAAPSNRPSVSSVAPRSGPLKGGTTITVRGSHFSSVRSVTISGVAGSKVRVASSSKLTVVVPKHAAGTYNVRVKTAKGWSAVTWHDRYGYVRPPSVAKVRLVKGSGLAGSTVRVSGANLTATTRVRFGKVAATTVARGTNTVDVRVPRNAPGRLHVTAATEYGVSPAQAADVYPMPTPVSQRWTQQTYLGLERGSLADVSCPTSDTCFAVDSYDAVFTVVDGVWSAPVHLDDGTYPALPSSISCPTTSFCAVAGMQYLFVFHDGVWSRGPKISESGGQLTDVSCSSPGRCVAITPDHFRVLADGAWSELTETPYSLSRIECVEDQSCIAVSSAPDGKAYDFDGITWTPMESLQNMSGMYELSCASATLCAARDFNSRVSVWDGANWSAPRVVERGSADTSTLSCVQTTCVYDSTKAIYVYTAGTWTRITDSATFHLTGCHTPTSCLGYDDLGHLAIFDGATWHKVGVQLDHVGPGSSIDCTSADFCAMSDQSGNVYTFDGTAWSSPYRIGDTYYKESAVSCPQETFCLATFGDRATATYDGTSWTAAPSPTQPQTSLACASATRCIAAGAKGSERFDGTSWKTINATAYRSLSCASATFCAALTADEIQTFDGTLWRHAVKDTELRNVDSHAVACPSTSFCLVLDGLGREITYRAGIWSAPSNTLSPFPTTVACYSATSCQAIGNNRSQTYDGHNWSAISADGSAYEVGDASALSCYGVQTCIAADWGVIFSSRPL